MALRLIVEDATGQRTVMPIVLDAAGELLIGRGPECGLRLNERNVSRRHAKLTLAAGAWQVHDLGAYNGVKVNGTRVSGQHPVVYGDAVSIGDFQLELRQTAGVVHETTKPVVLIGNDEGTEPEGEHRALVRKLAEEPTTPGVTAAVVQADAEAPGAAALSTLKPVNLAEEPTEILPRSEEPQKPAALQPPHAQLICVMGEHAGRTYAIDRATMVIGRTQENDIAIDHRSMSRHHAKVVVVQGHYRIIDLDSANGLLVNDEAYSETELKHGDVSELGHVKLRFVAPGEPAVLSGQEHEQVQANRRPKTQVHKQKRQPWLAVGALAASVVGSYIYLARAPDAEPKEPVFAQTDKTEDEHLLRQARQAIALRQYPRADALARAVLELDPSKEEARQILTQCEVELQGSLALEVATGAAGREDWASAMDALKNVPKASSANSRAATLMEQVRPALFGARAEVVKKALAADHLDEAERGLGELETMKGSAAELGELRQALDEAKKTHLVRSADSNRHSSAIGSSGASSQTSHSGHTSTEDARKLYADGTRALGQGKHQAAVDALLRCVSQDKSYARCYRALGIAYAKMGNGPKAVRYYRQYLKVDPEAKDASSVKQLLQQYDSRAEHSQSTDSAQDKNQSVP